MTRHRNVMSSPFVAATGYVEEDVDPMQSVANIADCMLVLACGLMLALVIYWNLDVSPDLQEVVESNELTQIEDDVEEGQMSMDTAGAGYEELGVVYRDPQTGKMYMLKTDTER